MCVFVGWKVYFRILYNPAAKLIKKNDMTKCFVRKLIIYSILSKSRDSNQGS